MLPQRRRLPHLCSHTFCRNTVKNNSNPKWDASSSSFVLELPPDAGNNTRMFKLRLRVLGHEDFLNQSDFLGQVEVPLTKVHAEAVLEKWFPLRPKAGSGGHDPSEAGGSGLGELKVRVQWLHSITRLVDYRLALSREVIAETMGHLEARRKREREMREADKRQKREAKLSTRRAAAGLRSHRSGSTGRGQPRGRFESGAASSSEDSRSLTRGNTSGSDAAGGSLGLRGVGPGSQGQSLGVPYGGPYAGGVPIHRMASEAPPTKAVFGAVLGKVSAGMGVQGVTQGMAKSFDGRGKRGGGGRRRGGLSRSTLGLSEAAAAAAAAEAVRAPPAPLSGERSEFLRSMYVATHDFKRNTHILWSRCYHVLGIVGLCPKLLSVVCTCAPQPLISCVCTRAAHVLRYRSFSRVMSAGGVLSVRPLQGLNLPHAKHHEQALYAKVTWGGHMSARTDSTRATSNPNWDDPMKMNVVKVPVNALRANESLHVSVWQEQQGMGLADMEVGRLEVPLGAAMDCCHGERGRSYRRWFPLLLPADAATVVGDQGESLKQDRSEEKEDSSFSDFIPLLQLELQWEPDLLPRDALASARSAKGDRWMLVSGQSLSVSLIDSERALDLMQVTVSDVDLRCAESDRLRIAATVAWIQVDNMLPTTTNNPVVLSPTAVRTPQPTLQVSIQSEPVGRGAASAGLANNLNTAVALLQELDVNLDEKWLVALWDFWSDLKVISVPMRSSIDAQSSPAQRCVRCDTPWCSQTTFFSSLAGPPEEHARTLHGGARRLGPRRSVQPCGLRRRVRVPRGRGRGAARGPGGGAQDVHPQPRAVPGAGELDLQQGEQGHTHRPVPVQPCVGDLPHGRLQGRARHHRQAHERYGQYQLGAHPDAGLQGKTGGIDQNTETLHNLTSPCKLRCSPLNVRCRTCTRPRPTSSRSSASSSCSRSCGS